MEDSPSPFLSPSFLLFSSLPFLCYGWLHVVVVDKTENEGFESSSRRDPVLRSDLTISVQGWPTRHEPDNPKPKPQGRLSPSHVPLIWIVSSLP